MTIIVKPGGDPHQIKLFYNGINDITIKKERLHIYTSVNHVIEDKPYAYQLINGEKKEILCHYKLDEQTLSFEFPLGYDKNHELIIDPTLIFSTFLGLTLTILATLQHLIQMDFSIQEVVFLEVNIQPLLELTM